MRSKNTNGFSLVEVVLVIAVVGLLAFGAWTLYQTEQQDVAEQQQPQSSQPPEINDSSDLAEVENYLQESNVEEELDTTVIDETFAESS